MFSLRKRTRRTPDPQGQTGISDVVAGVSRQIDQMAAIINDVGASASNRITAAEVVRSYTEFQVLSSVTEIWYSVRCLLDLDNPAEVRRAGWKLTLSCIDREEINNSAFAVYYHVIVSQSNVEDFDLVLLCLEHLTKNGRSIFDGGNPRNLPEVLVNWIQFMAVRSQEIRATPNAKDISAQWGTTTEQSFHHLLVYTANTLKFNMTIWEPLEIENLLLCVVSIVRNTSEIEDCQLCLSLVDAVMAFGLFPATLLQPILEVLCGIHSRIPALREQAQAIIWGLCSSHLRSSTFARLCRILDSPTKEITQGMRVVAAKMLMEILIESERGISLRNQAKARGGGILEEDRHTPQSSSQSQASPSHSAPQSPQMKPQPDVTNFVSEDLPVVEVSEAYYNTLKDPSTPMKVVLAVTDAVLGLVTELSTLSSSYSSMWLWQSENALPGTPHTIYLQLGSLYKQYSTALSEQKLDKSAPASPRPYISHGVTHSSRQSSPGTAKREEPRQEDSSQTAVTKSTVELPGGVDSEGLKLFRSKITKVVSVLTNSLIGKPSTTVTEEAVWICVELSGFLEEEECETLLKSIEQLHFCTPGVPRWYEHLKTLIDVVLVGRSGPSRVHVLRMIKEVYALDSEREGWVDTERLSWITEKTFACFGYADDAMKHELLEIYDLLAFMENKQVFHSATSQLVIVATNREARREARLSAVDVVVDGFMRAFKAYGEQAMVLYTALIDISRNSLECGDVFSRAWAVLCRLRTDRWDRLMFVEPIIEQSYGEALRTIQEPAPEKLARMTSEPSLVLKAEVQSRDIWPAALDMVPVLEVMLQVFQCQQSGASERTFIVTLINAASHLTHYRMFFDSYNSRAQAVLSQIRDALLQHVSNGGSEMPLSPPSSKKLAAVCICVHNLTILLPNKQLFQKAENDKLVYTMVVAMSQYNLTACWPVHCFTVCCYECPSSIQRYLPQILSRFQLKITNRDSSMYILDFLLSLSLEGSLTKNFTQQDYKRVFGMCFSFIQNANDLLQLSSTHSDVGAQWLLKLAYSAISNLFLSMTLTGRRELVPYLVRSLILADHNPDGVDPTSMVTYDMINRYAYSDMPLRVHMDALPKKREGWDVRRWTRGVSIIEIWCNRRTGDGIRIIRRPAGVFTTQLKPSVPPTITGSVRSDHDEEEDNDYYSSNFYFLSGQLSIGTFSTVNESGENDTSSSATSIAPNDPAALMHGAVLPIPIPEDAASNRAVSAIDRVPIVDFHKIGIIYVAPGQKTELEVLRNSSGSIAYRNFLSNIGVLIRLRHNRMFYVGGLDTEQDLDGEFAIAWNSKISQIIFQTITMMPAQDGDPAFASKKRHIGNNFVNIYFDESGQDFEFDVVKSQFNFINIVITPTYSKVDDQRYWKVRAYRKPGMKNTLAAYDFKVVSESNLALFVRNLGLKASQYAAVHNMGGDYTDNWVYRLQLIKKLRERVVQSKKDADSTEAATEDGSENDSEESKIDTRELKLLQWMDFTRYTI